MKKIVVLLIFLALLLTGCAKDNAAGLWIREDYLETFSNEQATYYTFEMLELENNSGKYEIMVMLCENDGDTYYAIYQDSDFSNYPISYDLNGNLVISASNDITCSYEVSGEHLILVNQENQQYQFLYATNQITFISYQDFVELFNSYFNQ